MISIIISTQNSELLAKISSNIQESIGAEFEIIAIENKAKYSICEAYNMGFAKAKYEFLCFVHEDVLFKINNWGARLISIMTNDDSIGLIGIAGTKFKASYPSALGQSPKLMSFMRGNLYHWDKYKDLDSNLQHVEIEDVVCIDGVFMFSKKDVFQHCRFDDKLLTHFHGYDIDFSLQVFFHSFRVLVDRGLLLAHYSDGNYSTQNTFANRKIAKKWMKKLPVATKDLNLSTFKIQYLNILNSCFFLITAIKRQFHIR